MPTRTKLTITEFESLPPPPDGRYELDEGELVKMTFPTPQHNRIAKRIFKALEDFVESRMLGEVFFPDTGYVLDREHGTVRGPDVSFLRRERLLTLDTQRNVPGAPDLAVEVVSPSDTIRDMRRKAAQYLIAGAVAVWVIDPDAREAQVYESGSERPRTLFAGDAIECPQLLPGFQLPLAQLFDSVPRAND